jgi:hypothetical protein
MYAPSELRRLSKVKGKSRKVKVEAVGYDTGFGRAKKVKVYPVK